MKTLLRGLVAGLVGTGAMTAAQFAAAKLRGHPFETNVPDRWADAPAPAQVVKKAADALGAGSHVTKDEAPLLTNMMHWTYGTVLGVLYAVAARALRPQPFLGGVGFGLGVWSASYAQLVPLGIYNPPLALSPPSMVVNHWGSPHRGGGYTESDGDDRDS